MNFSSAKRPYDNFIAKEYSIDLLEFLFEGILMYLIAEEDDRYIPFVSCIFLFNFEHSTEPSIVVMITFNFLGQFYDNFR